MQRGDRGTVEEHSALYLSKSDCSGITAKRFRHVRILGIDFDQNVAGQ